MLVIDKTRTTTVHPQSDGMVKRFNRTLLNSLSFLVSSNQQDWNKKLPFFLLAYRSAVHETTGYSPSQMPFGQDLLFSRPPEAPLAPEEYIEKLQARMEEMHHLATERISMASAKMKTRYDARATGHDFHEGGNVWLWNPKRRKGLSPKLQTNWEGPYTVLKRLNDVVVRIQKSPHSKPKQGVLMSDLSDVKSIIIGALIAGASVSRTANFGGVSRTVVSRMGIEEHTHPKMQEYAAADNVREMNTHIQNPVSVKTLQRKLHAVNIHGEVDIPKAFDSARNALKRLQDYYETT
ncbi:retrovirus-related Pol polyprotein from transposon 412 [Trichonephila clavipes]|nr:retrovirus-related Pol polyprotein from transposon 412 [Trichonephila clavipes]